MVEGSCATGFERVREAFASCFDELGETGAAVAATVDGDLVVDLHGGWADAARTRRWRRDTLVCVWSVTKPWAALAVLRLAERGALSLDDPVAVHWPDYAAAGKEGTTVRHLLAHQAGLVRLAEELDLETLLDHERLVHVLAAAAPEWEPGRRHGEHALLYGTLLGEVVRRVDGRPLGRFLREEVASPARIDLNVGLGDGELARVADLVDPDGAWRNEMLASPFAPALAAQAGVLDVATANGERWRRAELAAVNGHASAVGVARLYAALAAGGELDGTHVLRRETVDEMLAPQAEGVDELLGEPVRWGLGLHAEDEEGFGMGGVGGSLGYGRRTPQPVSFAYVTARMGAHDRSTRCEEAFEAALAAPGR
jgi:CubicO group peptidase (beta-lactamase class C family)